MQQSSQLHTASRAVRTVAVASMAAVATTAAVASVSGLSGGPRSLSSVVRMSRSMQTVAAFGRLCSVIALPDPGKSDFQIVASELTISHWLSWASWGNWLESSGRGWPRIGNFDECASAHADAELFVETVFDFLLLGGVLGTILHLAILCSCCACFQCCTFLITKTQVRDAPLMHTCSYTHSFTCVRRHTLARLHARQHPCPTASQYACIPPNARTHMQTCMHACMQSCTHACLHVCMHK